MGWRPAFTPYTGTGGGGGGGGGGALRVFEYAITGAPATTTGDFTIPIPAPALADVNYTAIVTLGGVAFQSTIDVVHADNAVGTIHVVTGAILTVGDVLGVVIQENT